MEMSGLLHAPATLLPGKVALILTIGWYCYFNVVIYCYVSPTKLRGKTVYSGQSCPVAQQ
jgi:hypothetical protein